MWIPDKEGTRPDLLATTGDYLRLWEVTGSGEIKSKCLLNNVSCEKEMNEKEMNVNKRRRMKDKTVVF